MSFISEDAIEEVRARADITDVVGAYVTLQKRGGEFWCCCPFHKEKTPSFKLNSSLGLYHCFGCGASGTVFKFVQEMENVDFPSAVRLLARQTGVHIPEEAPRSQGGSQNREVTKDTVLETLGKTAEWFRQQLALPEAQLARDYLSNRGIDRDSITRFGIGYAPDSWDALMNWGQRQGMSPKLLLAAGLLAEREREGGGNRTYDRFRGRVMFPIWDELGRVAGFSGRILDAAAKTAKYVNSPETMTFHKGRLLYCLNLARKSFKESGKALVCEGQLDTIACHRAGLTHAVAPQGTAFTEDQAKLLRRHTENVVFAFDADAAGVKAAVRSVEVALQADLKAKVVVMPEGEDPDGIFTSQGAEGLKAVMSREKDAFEFLFDTAARGKNLQQPHDKEAVVSQVLGVISQVAQPVTQAALCQWLGAKVGVPESAIFDSLNLMVKKKKRTNRFARSSQGYQRPGRESDAAAEKGQDAAPVPPPFTPADAAPEITPQTASALENLLDLALHYEAIAEQLVVNEHLTPESLGTSGVERALLLVLQKTAEDEWQERGKAIGTDDSLAADPVVASLLDSSRFNDPTAMPDSQRERWEQRIAAAAEDCVHVIERNYLEVRERQLQQEILQGDPSETVSLLENLKTISQRRRNLHPSKR